MPVDDERIRRSATDHFMNEGLGGKLTRNAYTLIRSREDGYRLFDERILSVLVCGNIIERIQWTRLGEDLGYFGNTTLVSSQERDFLKENSEILREYRWPNLFGDVLSLLVDASIETGAFLFPKRVLGSKLPYNARQLRPIFQASHVISECLTEGPITSFFLFVLKGDHEEFSRLPPSPDGVFEALEHDGSAYEFPRGFLKREDVIAGFIRYTEFLSAMDTLFPESLTATYQPELLRRPPEDVINRELLVDEIRGMLRWRFSGDKAFLECYRAVRFSFLKMVADQFRGYPDSGVQWSVAGCYGELMRLSHRFIGVEEFRDEREIDRFTSGGMNDFVANDLERRLREMEADLKRLRENG